jgi:hypothetical protein
VCKTKNIQLKNKFMGTEKTSLENKNQSHCLGEVNFNLFQELYGSYVQMDDRFETVHVWCEELALRNKGRWTPILISKAKYETEKLHPWNN